MYTSFMNNQLPALWGRVSFASLKSLASWNKDLLFRCGKQRQSADPFLDDAEKQSDHFPSLSYYLPFESISNGQSLS